MFTIPGDFDFNGWRPTPRLRIVNGWFAIRAEQLWESEDGAMEWRRYRGLLSVSDIQKFAKENAA
jgi:hypothetical protein